MSTVCSYFRSCRKVEWMALEYPSWEDQWHSLKIRVWKTLPGSVNWIADATGHLSPCPSRRGQGETQGTKRGPQTGLFGQGGVFKKSELECPEAEPAFSSMFPRLVLLDLPVPWSQINLCSRVKRSPGEVWGSKPPSRSAVRSKWKNSCPALTKHCLAHSKHSRVQFF